MIAPPGRPGKSEGLCRFAAGAVRADLHACAPVGPIALALTIK